MTISKIHIYLNFNNFNSNSFIPQHESIFFVAEEKN